MAKYSEVIEWIRKYIISSGAVVGDKIPPELIICKELGASRQTVRKAICQLTQEGVLSSKKGSGTYITGFSSRTYNSHSKNIAVVLTYLDSYIFPHKLNGMYPVFSRNGYMVTIFSSGNGLEAEAATLRKILDSDFAGVLLEPGRSALPRSDPRLYSRLLKKFPVILLETELPGISLPLISIDDEKGGYTATNHLIKNGHTGILHIGKIDDYQGILRYKGYLRALCENGIEASEENLLCVTNDVLPLDTFFESKADELLEKLRNVTAVFCYNDLVADALMILLAKHGIRVPDDISIVGYDDSFISSQRSLTGIAHPKEELGRKAAENMINLIENPIFSPAYTFEPELIIRDSVNDIRRQRKG